MNEFYSSLISGTLSGLITGLIVGLFLYYFQKRRDEDEKSNINFNKLKKRLPKDIIKFIQPGISFEKIKEYLGAADFYGNAEQGCFTEYSDPQKTNSYLYNFINARLKITSQDNITIDTVTIFSNPLSEGKKKLQIEVFLNPYHLDEGGAILGQSKLTKNNLENVSNHFSNRSSREMIFGIETYHGRFGNYMNYSYFGYHAPNFEKYEQTNNPENLIGGTIEGFCISRLSNFAPYIAIYE